MSARTPRPWKLAEGHERSGADHYIWADALPGHVLPPDCRAICTVHADPDIAREADANADFIVTACNAHDELVAALRLARECIAYCRRAHKDAQSGQGIPAEVIIDAALAKVQP